jgi:small subunit ribosomal protein S17
VKQFVGQALKSKMLKTAKVVVVHLKVHPLYKKRLKIKKIYHVHDEIGVKPGDWVKFQACRPLSKTKKWQIMEVIKKEKSKKDKKQ